MCLEVFIGQGFNCNCRKQSGMLMSHQPLVMYLWHMQSSPHIRQRWFPRWPQLRVHHHHVVHFSSFMQFIDNCLRAHSSSICLAHTAHAPSWACPISHTPPAFSSGKSGITIWFPRGLTHCCHFLLFCSSWPWYGMKSSDAVLYLTVLPS